MANDPATTRAPEPAAVDSKFRRLIKLAWRWGILTVATHRLALQIAVHAAPTLPDAGVAGSADAFGVLVI